MYDISSQTLLEIIKVWVKNITLNIVDKVKHYIRIKINNTIVLIFWDKNCVECLIW